MEPVHGISTKLEAEISLGIGSVQVVRNFWNEPIDVSRTLSMHYLELTLLPSSYKSLGCFPNDWGPRRFEPFGGMCFLPAQRTVRAKSDCRHHTSIICNFDPASVDAWFGGELEWTDDRLQGSLNIVNANIRSLLLRVGEETCNPGFASETLVELLASQAALELSRHLQGIGKSKAIGGLSSWRLKLIDERLAEDSAFPSLAELANLCHLSVRQLARAFRVSRGRSIGSYIAERRVDQAKWMLAAGMSVKAVAYTSGFSMPSNFSAAFLRATGETPQQYKQRVHRKMS